MDALRSILGGSSWRLTVCSLWLSILRSPKKVNLKKSEVDACVFNNMAGWIELDGDLKEEDPPNMPSPLGGAVSVTVFIDADHGK